MQQFFNAPEAVVDEMLSTLTELFPMSRSEPASGVRIVVRDDVESAKTRVVVLSGGGAGHEPAHAGFIGEGMLTGAISGDVFASPSAEAVLAAIRHTTGPRGCLLVVKNYTGDRLNFGLAVERAREEGIDARVVVIADDLALGVGPRARGVAGTVLVHKLAGHLAEAGRSLDEIEALCRTYSAKIVSMGLALSSSLVPGRGGERRSAELGLGIHNEPGRNAVSPADASHAMALVLDPLLDHVNRTHGDATKLVVLLNDLGGCSPQELLVLTRALLERIGPSRISLLVRPAALMTSIDMRGFSVTLAPADDVLVEALSSSTKAPAWPGVIVPRRVSTFAPRLSAPLVHDDADTRDAALGALVRAAAHALVAGASDLDALDAAAGDGDTGTTFATFARAVLARLDEDTLSTGKYPGLFRDLGRIAAHVMGGSSGALLSIFFTAAATKLAERGDDDAARALLYGASRMTAYGGADVGDRTLLDALVPALGALSVGLDAAAKEARSGATKTASLVARAGRAAYVPEEKTRGNVDAGAEAIARVFEALAAAKTAS